MKNIVITGSRKGIGRFLSEQYLEMGHRVFGCSRSESDLKHENYHHYQLDVSSEKKTIAMFRDIRKKFSHIDVLINNAGQASMNHSLLTPGSKVEELIRTNFLGTFLFAREAAKVMKKSQAPRIINFSTVAVPLNLEGEAAYAATKAAVVSLTKVLAKELAPFKITVNAIGPTPIETDLIRSVPDNKIQDLIAQQAINRLGTFDDVINVTDFFINEKSDYITGQIIYLGGVCS